MVVSQMGIVQVPCATVTVKYFRALSYGLHSYGLNSLHSYGFSSTVMTSGRRRSVLSNSARRLDSGSTTWIAQLSLIVPKNNPVVLDHV